jgi:hypothetical protein
MAKVLHELSEKSLATSAPLCKQSSTLFLEIVMRTVCTVLAVLFAANLSADPLCGAPGLNDPMFKNGFEDGQFLAVKTKPFFKLNLANKSTPLAVTVTYPTDGITVGSSSLQVYGTFTGPANTGVTVNGAAALAAGSNYLQNVRLTSGSNVITVLVTNFAGISQTVTRTVTYTPANLPDVSVESAFTGDYAPFNLRYSVSVKPGINNPTITRIRVDYDGNATFETDVTDPTTRLVGRYNTPGIYAANIEVTLDDGNITTPPQIVSVTRRTLAENLDLTRQTLCATFENLRTNIGTGLTTTAMLSFNPVVRPDYQAFIAGFGSNGPTVAAALGEIADGTIGQETATAILSRAIPGQPGKFRGYGISFSRETDGVWRMTAF